jgi:hypothetical protein
VWPSTGHALTQRFLVTTNGWTALPPHLPLTFALHAVVGGAQQGGGYDVVPVTLPSLAATHEVVLPAGTVAVRVAATDAVGATSWVEAAVTVTQPLHTPPASLTGSSSSNNSRSSSSNSSSSSSESGDLRRRLAVAPRVPAPHPESFLAAQLADRVPLAPHAGDGATLLRLVRGGGQLLAAAAAAAGEGDEGPVAAPPSSGSSVRRRLNGNGSSNSSDVHSTLLHVLHTATGLVDPSQASSNLVVSEAAPPPPSYPLLALLCLAPDTPFPSFPLSPFISSDV